MHRSLTASRPRPRARRSAALLAAALDVRCGLLTTLVVIRRHPLLAWYARRQ